MQPLHDVTLPPHYTVGLHAWFLKQVQQDNPALSAMLHDNQTEKSFTLSGLDDVFPAPDEVFTLWADQTYTWQISALATPLVQWLEQWLTRLPGRIPLYKASLRILAWSIVHPPTTYQALLAQEPPADRRLCLSFLSPTSFRRQGNHLPLPMPRNVFHSYLRRWTTLASQSVPTDAFLDWVDTAVVIDCCWLTTQKVVVGKPNQLGNRGLLTGFVGSLELLLATKPSNMDTLFFALGRLAPYCGTGHKTTVGLGHTLLGWLDALAPEPDPDQDPAEPIAEYTANHTVERNAKHLDDRIATLTNLFLAQRKRTGGDRANYIAQTWATILARREQGESLKVIATDLTMPYETVKTYAKLARRALKQTLDSPQES